MTRSKAIGTAAETAVARFLARWWPHAERRQLHGTNDKGDITGTPGICWEVKARIKDGYDFPGWLRELDVEMTNANEALGLVVIKPKGVGTDRPEKFWALMPLPQACQLLADSQTMANASQLTLGSVA